MGQWNYDSYKQKEVLPKPKTAEQRFVHMCDYLASRKFIDVKFNGNDIKDWYLEKNRVGDILYGL